MYGSNYYGSDYYASGYYGALRSDEGSEQHTTLTVTATSGRVRVFLPKTPTNIVGSEHHTTLGLMATPMQLRVFTPKTEVYEPEGGPSDGAFLQDDDEVIMLVARAFLTMVN